MSKKMFSRERERERGKLRFSALLILIGLLLFGCDPTMVTITYNANGGKGEMKPQAVESGVEVKLNANTFTKDGSDFTGWNEAADGSGKAYADGATVAPAGNLTLYAQWQAKSTPENPGTEDPGTENPGTEDPESPVVLEDHITNLPLIKAVEDAYRQSSGSEFGWTKTADGYVDMTNEANKTLVEGVTSLGTDGDMYLNGIEYFTGLQELKLFNNSVLTELPDLTSFSNLRTLFVTFTTESEAVSSLTAVSGLPASLEKLDLSENKLTTLDVSKLANLTYLMVFNNELTELDITNNAQLTVLSCFNNRMTALDITNVTAFSQEPTEELIPILACGMQRNDNGPLTLTATQAQQKALAPLFPPEGTDEGLDGYQLSNFNVVWDVPKAELGLTAGTAVFNAASGLELPFTVVNTGALTEEKLTQLLTNATKKVTLFTADNETGTPVETRHISHGVNVSTPYILVVTAAFPPESTTYSKIEVVLQAEGYETQTLTYTDVSVNPEQPGGGESDVDLQLTEGTAVFNKTDGLTLSFGEGQALPENVNVDDVVVSLGDNQVDSQHVSIKEDRTAIIVALAGLTNDTVDMTVTVTVSAEGYNDAVLRYEGVNTVWIPDGVTATFDNTEKIGGESVSVTISPELSGVTIDSGTYSVVGESATKPLAINGDRLSFTAPILEEAVAAETGTTVTVSLVLAKANAESVTVSSTLKVYPETHVRFDGKFYALAQGFNFTDVDNLSGVTYKDGAATGVPIPSEKVDENGFTFTVDSGKDQITLPTTGIGDAVLTMFDLKWNDSSDANVYVFTGSIPGDGWGFSVYKEPTDKQGSFLIGGTKTAWAPKDGSLWSYTAPDNTFDQYFIYDNGTEAPIFGRGSVTEVYRVTDNDHSQSKDKFSSITPFTIFFEDTHNDNDIILEYTLRAVNFYKEISQQ